MAWPWLMACVLLAGAPGTAAAQLDVPDLIRSVQHGGRSTYRGFFAQRRLAQQVAELDSATVAASVPAVISALEDPDPRVRTGAATILTILGPAAREAVPALVTALQDSFAPLRVQAAHALARIGPPETTVPRLSALLQDTGYVPIRVAMALEMMGPDAMAAVPAFVDALRDDDLRWSAARALTRIGSAAAAALPALQEAWEAEERDHVRLAIFYAIRAIQPDAAAALTEIGVPVTEPTLSLLGVSASRRSRDSTINSYIGRLGDRDANVRLMSVRSIARLPDGLAPARRHPVIAQVFAAVAPDEDAGVRSEIIAALSSVRSEGGPVVVTTMTWALRDPDSHVRQRAVYALGNAGPRVDAVPELVAAIQGDPDPEVRKGALWVISRLFNGIREQEARATHGETVLRALTMSVTDPDSAVGRAAVEALFRVDRDTGLRVLAEEAQSPDSTVRALAVSQLSGLREAIPSIPELMVSMHRDVRDAIPILNRALADESATVRAMAVRALGRAHARWQGDPAPEPGLVASVIERLNDEDIAVRRAAAGALADFGRASEPAVPALTEILRDPDIGMRRQAASALGDIGPGAAPAVPALIEALGDADEIVRRFAAGALGEIGPAAGAADEALLTLRREDPSPEVRNAAVRALSKILR